jgi:hypothetical protein
MGSRSKLVWIASAGLGLLVCTGCSEQKSATKAGGAAMKPAPIGVSQISHIVPGDTLIDVIREEGPPTGMQNNVYYYRQRGRIVFAGKTPPVDATKVLRVEPDPAEDGKP